MKPMKIGIMPKKKVQARVLAIAGGDIKPRRGEPKIWFTSMKSLAEVLSDDNRVLLKVIEVDPVVRTPGNLSRTLKTMSNYGIVEMRREKKLVRPIVKATEFRIFAA